MPNQIEKELFREKVQRDDSATYVGNLLVRQRLINEAAVGFSQEFLPTKARVIDACAGPEGSWLASAKRGYRWIGNDICIRFSRDLAGTGANAVLADFAHAPYSDAIADGVFFIFALNNIYNPRAAFQQASRITTEKGIVIETEPGLSTWVSSILLHSLLVEDPHYNSYLQRSKFNNEVLDHFKDKPYSETEYVDFVIEQTLGSSREEMLLIAQTSVDSNTRRPYKFYEEVTRRYFQNVLRMANEAGFELIKAGVLAAGLNEKTNFWTVSHPVPLDVKDWLSQLCGVRKWKRRENPLISNFPSSLDSSSKRIIVPILCLRKNQN